MSSITSRIIEDHHIEDGVIYLKEFTKEHRAIGAPTEAWWKVGTVREGTDHSRRYRNLKVARNRFEAIKAAHTPPKGYTPPSEPPKPSGWGRFG